MACLCKCPPLVLTQEPWVLTQDNAILDAYPVCVLCFADDTRKLSTLQLLVGYLKILGSGVATLVNSHAHLSRLMLAIVQVRPLLTHGFIPCSEY